MIIQPGDPLGYRIGDLEHRTGFPSASADHIPVLTSVRALEGMQKEAVVEYGATGTGWRMVCDEGPWLNGTDLAPFPLGFFTAGLAASCLSAFMAEADERGVSVESPGLLLDNFFTMEGSALRGTMTAGVKSTEMRFSDAGDTTAAGLADIARAAVAERSPAARCLTSELPGEFLIQINGRHLAMAGTQATTSVGLSDPAPLFSSIEPGAGNSRGEEMIRKLADDSAGPEMTDTLVGLQPEQKRTVHVRTRGRIRADGLKVLKVQCIHPVGSVFELLSDDSAAAGGRERAPSGLALLSCGVAFCFMTQIGRYAQIAKQQLRGYRIAQATGFRLAGENGPSAEPVQTLVCLDTDEPEQKSRELVRMSGQTCYLHAAYRGRTSVTI